MVFEGAFIVNGSRKSEKLANSIKAMVGSIATSVRVCVVHAVVFCCFLLGIH
jgi:hypothetical protein